MILRKVIVNNKEMFIPLTKEEAKEFYQNEELIFTDKKEEQEFINFVNNDIEVEVLKEEEHKPKEEFKETIDDKVKRFSRKMEEVFDKAFEQTTQGVKNAFSNINKKSKANKLLALLPFMSEEDLKVLVEQVIAFDEQVKDLPLESIMPFISSEDCDRIFLHALENKSYKYNIVSIAPFVSNEALDKAVDLYIEGKLEIEKIDRLYPYLTSKSIKKIFDKLMKE